MVRAILLAIFLTFITLTPVRAEEWIPGAAITPMPSPLLRYRLRVDPNLPPSLSGQIIRVVAVDADYVRYTHARGTGRVTHSSWPWFIEGATIGFLPTPLEE